jgi:malate synthase
MAAQIPIKDNPDANAIAMEKVRLDKVREAKDGHDGTWVAHPGLVSVAKEIFNEFMPGSNQIKNKREDVNVSSEDLLTLPIGTITLEGLKTNIDVGIQYIEAWLRGNGCVPIYNLMEDAATAEISRTQVWQWLNNDNSALEDGSRISDELYSSLLAEQVENIREMVGEERFNKGAYRLAAEIFDSLVREKKFTEFLTLKAYKYI